MSINYKEASEILKALAHPVRLKIVDILRGLSEEECYVGFVQEKLDLPQSTVSQHLTKLKDKGIIEGERNKVEICYRVIDDRAEEILSVLKK